MKRFAPLVIAATALLAYANTFHVPFVFDDIAAITQNPSIAHFSTALFPPDALSVTGRPLANLSFAFNYAISGRDPWSYHALNVALHILNGLLLFAVMRRAAGWSVLAGDSAVVPSVASRFPPARVAGSLAFGITLLWTLHPLQTSVVTYVMQRTELLATCCYLTTLFAFTRAVQCHPLNDAPARARWWLAASVAACALGMAAKEIVVTAPLAVLLYDHTFLTGSFSAALRSRPRYYAALGATWLVLVALLLGTDSRGASAGFGSAVAWTDYALTQFPAITRYVGLVVWPSPLVFDYGNPIVRDAGAIFGGVVVVAAFTVLALRTWRRRPDLACALVFFFLILAPTSSIVPITTQTIAEHRVYLASSALIAVVALTLHRALGSRLFVPLVLSAIALGTATFTRNRDYATVLSLWRDTAIKTPANARAHYNHGLAALDARLFDAAEHAFTAAITADARHGDAFLKRGTLRAGLGRATAALPDFETAARLLPDSAVAHYNYGRALVDAQRYPEALSQFEAAARLDPADASARKNADSLRAFLRQP